MTIALVGHAFACPGLKKVAHAANAGEANAKKNENQAEACKEELFDGIGILGAAGQAGKRGYDEDAQGCEWGDDEQRGQ